MFLLRKGTWNTEIIMVRNDNKPNGVGDHAIFLDIQISVNGGPNSSIKVGFPQVGTKELMVFLPILVYIAFCGIPDVMSNQTTKVTMRLSGVL